MNLACNDVNNLTNFAAMPVFCYEHDVLTPRCVNMIVLAEFSQNIYVGINV